MEKYYDESLSAVERAEDLTDKMTAEEQASMLRYDSPALPRLNIPAYNWWNEGLHGLARSGVATMFPQAIGLAATFDTNLILRAGEITSIEARAKYNQYIKHGDRDIYKGLTLWAPNINIFRDPRWGRGQETFGEDPFLTSLCGQAYIKGIQGDGRVLRAAACAKHFAVHSGPEAIRHSFNAEVSPKDMEETYLPAFEAAVKAGVEGIMGAYNRVNGDPACASDFLMSKLKKWGFKGYFVSDCWAIQDFHQHHCVTSSPMESAALAIKKGCNINCGCTYTALISALREEMITEQDIRSSCIAAMATRIRLGMFDKSTEYDDIPYSALCCKEHKEAALECSEKSMVLLKNDGLLPLDENSISTIAVIGPNSDSRACLEGNYNGMADRYVTFLEGIQDRFSGRVLYSEGCHLYKDRVSDLALENDRLSEAVITAENSDVVILCVGLDASLEGEEGDTGNAFASGDKHNLMLPLSQRILIKEIMKLGKPTVIVTAAGSSINTEAQPNALLHVWYPGAEGGKALAEILFGDISPSGKLPVTFYEKAEYLPEFTDYSMKNRTYRYTEFNVLYPFGYGLTYSKTICTDIEFNGGTARVTAENVGNRETDDVIQLYIKDYCSNAVPNHSLCGFKRIRLKPGQSKTVEIPISDKSFTAVSKDGNRGLYGTRFTLYASTHQPDKLSCKLSQTDFVKTDIEIRTDRNF